jgi:TonB family protein
VLYCGTPRDTVYFIPRTGEVRIDTVLSKDSLFLTPSPQPIGGVKNLAGSIVFPELARMAGIEGQVRLSATIDSSGRAVSTEILNTTDDIFSNAATEGIRRAWFSPALNCSRPPQTLIIPITFILHFEQIERFTLESRDLVPDSPVFNVTFNSDGSCRYVGTRNVPRLGTFNGRIRKAQFLRIGSYIKRQFALASERLGHYTSPPDERTMLATYTETDSTHVLYSNGSGGYDCFWVVDAIVDKAVRSVSWVESLDGESPEK